MVKKQKYYVVWNGVNPGVYNSWADCLAQTKSYPNAQYKSFKSKNEAELAYTMSYSDFVSKSIPSKTKSFGVKINANPDIDQKAIAVDAACSGNPGPMEYRGVYVKDAVEIFRIGPLKKGTNNIGEFLAIVHALALLAKNKTQAMTIYTDSRTAIAWVRKKKANTKLKKSKINLRLFEMIDRAESWLKQNTYPHKIVKWDTKKWGEIPADFGRK